MTEYEGVVPVLAKALSNRGYETLTPVQQAVLSPELGKSDMLVSAQTGSGKTVAFGISIAAGLLEGAESFTPANTPLALVIAPTRELALQVKRELQWLYENTGAAFASCVGGMDMRDERRALQRGAHIVVGTPGRLRDHIERGTFDPTGLKAVVLDEADEMLDLGFRDDLEHILDAAPVDRRTLMFSATVPRSIESLAKRYQREAVRVTTASERTQHLDIDYRALTVAPGDEENAIVNVLRFFEAKNALVFCSTRAAVNRMTSRFTNRGFSVVALSGELSQNERTHALQALRDGRARVCIATDVAARGLDLPNLDLVVHADIPRNSETLLHRSGRTGRAGRKGTCVLIVPYNARKRTMRLLGNAGINASWASPPNAEEVMQQDQQRLLTDPGLAEPPSDTEAAFAQELLSRHSAEQIAAAYVRKYFADQAAPEELREDMPPEPKPRQRNDFDNGAWISLSIGRDGSAEPRWLLPMLCRFGHLSKKDIGAIRVQRKETFVELLPDCIDRFLKALGPNPKLENNIAVRKLDGAPDLSATAEKPVSERPKRAGKPQSAENQHRKKEKRARDVTRPSRKPTIENDPFEPGTLKPKSPPENQGSTRSEDEKYWAKLKVKSTGKKQKPGAKSARSGFRSGKSARPGNAPLKRKKQQKP